MQPYSSLSPDETPIGAKKRRFAAFPVCFSNSRSPASSSGKTTDSPSTIVDHPFCSGDAAPSYSGVAHLASPMPTRPSFGWQARRRAHYHRQVGTLALCPPYRRWLRRLICLPRKRKFRAGSATINTTGKSLLIIRNRVKPSAQKYSAFVLAQISRITPPVSPDERGARERHERAVRCDGRGRRDRRTRLKRTAKSCGSDVAVLALSPGDEASRDDGGKRAVLREEHEVSRKAIAQGRPECSRCPVCSCAVLFAQIARETAGAASTRSSLRPLSSGGQTKMQTSGALRREIAASYSVVVTREGG